MTFAPIYLARHGQTDDNVPPLRFQGQSDTLLNELGVRQAQELAGEVTGLGFQALYTSHLSRARRTAEIVGERLDLEPIVDERLAEGFRGTWEGRLMADVEREEPDAFAAWLRADPDFRFPGGESLAEHRVRAVQAVGEIAARHELALIITHGGTIRFVLLELRGLDTPHFHEFEIANGKLISLDAGATERLARVAQASSH